MVVSLLLLFSIFAVADGGSDQHSPTGGVHENDVGTVTSSDPKMKDATGMQLPSAKVGKLVVLSTAVLNDKKEEISFVSFIEVRNEDGVTVYLQWGMGSAISSGSTEIGLSWTPEKTGKYELRTFAISNFTRPQLVTTVSHSDATVTE
jgi:hypothetical protein